MFEGEGIDTQRVALVGVFGAVLAFILIVAVQVLFYRMEKADEFKKIVSERPRELVGWRTEWATEMGNYRWVDREAKTVAVPIERAMELEVRSLSHP